MTNTSQNKRLTAAIVEDEQNIRDLLQAYLEADDWSVAFTARNGTEAIRMASQNNGQGLHLILLDNNMPDIDDMSGLNGTKTYKGIQKYYPNVFPMILTGYATPELQIEANAAGIYTIITKPILPIDFKIYTKFARQEIEKRDRL